VAEIRPIPPAGRRTAAGERLARHWLLRADPAAGTLTWTQDRALRRTAGGTVTLALPGSGRPGAVARVCFLRYRWRMRRSVTEFWKLLLLDDEGRVLAAGRAYGAREGPLIWPPELFAPLRELGVGLVQEQFGSARAARAAYPGAVPLWWLSTRWGPPLAGGVLAAAILLIAGVAVFLGTR
jgi:hypothetical protein